MAFRSERIWGRICTSQFLAHRLSLWRSWFCTCPTGSCGTSQCKALFKMWVTHTKKLSLKGEEVCHPPSDDASAHIWLHGELRALPAPPTMRSNLERPCGRSHEDVSSLVAFVASWHSQDCHGIFRASALRAMSQALTGTGRFTF